MDTSNRLTSGFYTRDVLIVAPEILGKKLIMKFHDGSFMKYSVTDVEAYRGAEDKACHASRGRTARNEIMYHSGGSLYIYLVYGMYWMLNIVTGSANDPQAILIRGIENCNGPGRVTRLLGIDRSFYGEDLSISERIWFENASPVTDFKTGPRIGIDYAGEYWKTRLWRFYI
jgi:DNA-3-methyladenine glycosylase